MCSPHLESQDGAFIFMEKTLPTMIPSSPMTHYSKSCTSTNGQTREAMSHRAPRCRRNFMPREKKDDSYWDKRQKNNEAARRSREKRRVNNAMLEQRMLTLMQENSQLRAEILALRFRFGTTRARGETPILSLTAVPSDSSPPAPCSYLTYSDGGHPMSIAHQTPAQDVPHRGKSSWEATCTSKDSGFSTPGGSSVGSHMFDRLGKRSMLSLGGREEAGYESNPLEGELHPEARGGVRSPSEIRLSRVLAPKRETLEAMKSLPHKLRFKSPSGEGSCGDISRIPRDDKPLQPAAVRDSPCTDAESNWYPHQEQHVVEDGRGGHALERQCYPWSIGVSSKPLHSPAKPSRQMENIYLKTQLRSLRKEVAQLKRLFSQKLLSKAQYDYTVIGATTPLVS